MIRRIVVAAVPEGLVKESDFRLESVAEPECPEGGVLIRTTYISVDPYLRGRLTGNRTYIEPILVGEAMEGGCVGEVIESRREGFAVGDAVTGMWAWQEVVAHPGKGLRKLDPSVAPVSTALGILGMPGMTAYFGFLDLCQPKEGDTVFVSGAAGAVGSYVGQIAKLKGCRVVGSAGTDEKTAWLKELGFDGTLNYRKDKPYADALDRLCPEGIDCYFDNVGGELTDAVFTRLNVFARVSLCGQISMYNDRSRDIGPRPYWLIVTRQIRVEGFIISRWMERWPEGIRQMAEWLAEGKLRSRETVFEGLENAPKAFQGLFTGANIGKAIVKL